MAYQAVGAPGSVPETLEIEQSQTSASTSNGDSIEPKPRCFGEEDGHQLLSLPVQWTLSLISVGCMLWCLVTPWLNKDSMKGMAGVAIGRAYVWLPPVVGVVSWTLSISFAGKFVDKSVVLLVAWFCFGFFASWMLGVVPQYIVGTSAASVFSFYMVVALMDKESGQGHGDEYMRYTFLAPTMLGLCNGFGFLMEAHFLTTPGSRWTASVLSGGLGNYLTGKLSGNYNFPLPQYTRYMVGSVGFYTVVFFGIIRPIESFIFQ